MDVLFTFGQPEQASLRFQHWLIWATFMAPVISTIPTKVLSMSWRGFCVTTLFVWASLCAWSAHHASGYFYRLHLSPQGRLTLDYAGALERSGRVAVRDVAEILVGVQGTRSRANCSLVLVDRSGSRWVSQDERCAQVNRAAQLLRDHVRTSALAVNSELGFDQEKAPDRSGAVNAMAGKGVNSPPA